MLAGRCGAYRALAMRWEGQGGPDPRNDDDSTGSTPLDFAVRLLEFQQRMAAFDRLYNEEITKLTELLSELIAEFLRQYQALAQGSASTTKPKRSRRKAGRPETPRGAPRRPAGGKAPQEG
jgi:hypothetical protein